LNFLIKLIIMKLVFARHFSTKSLLNKDHSEEPDKIIQNGESIVIMTGNEQHNLNLISDYKHIDKYRAGFNELAAVAGYEIIMSVLAKVMRETASRRIVFLFTPDLFKLDIAGTKEEKDYKLFVRPAGAEFTGEFVFPRLSHA